MNSKSINFVFSLSCKSIILVHNSSCCSHQNDFKHNLVIERNHVEQRNIWVRVIWVRVWRQGNDSDGNGRWGKGWRDVPKPAMRQEAVTTGSCTTNIFSFSITAISSSSSSSSYSCASHFLSLEMDRENTVHWDYRIQRGWHVGSVFWVGSGKYFRR